MKNEFVALDSKLSVEDGRVSQYYFLKLQNFRLALSLIVGSIAVVLLLRYMRLTRETNGWAHTGLVAMFGIVSSYYIQIAFSLLFVRYWKKELDISKIKTIEVKDKMKVMESHVLVTLKNKRCKTYKFRILEDQLQPFVKMLMETNSGIQMTTRHRRLEAIINRPIEFKSPATKW